MKATLCDKCKKQIKEDQECYKVDITKKNSGGMGFANMLLPGKDVRHLCHKCNDKLEAWMK